MKYIITILIALIFTLFLFAGLSGDFLDNNQTVASLFIGLFFILISTTLFLVSALPTRKHYPKLFIFSVGCICWSVFQIPVSFLIAGKFPLVTDSAILASVSTIGLLVSLIGPGIPGFTFLLSSIRKTKDQLNKIANQQVDPIVTTPADKAEAQGTQGHP